MKENVGKDLKQNVNMNTNRLCWALGPTNGHL